MRRGRLAVVVVAAGAALVVGGVLVRPRPAPFGSHTLAFVCDGAICVWDGKHDARRVVARVDGGYATSPVWSPDGARLSFIHTPDRSLDVSIRPRHDLYVVDADGSNRVRLVAGVTETVYGLPFAWSSNAASLVVSLDAPGSRVQPATERGLVGPRGDLHLVDVVGGARRRLTRTTLFDGYPRWVSPRRVVYARMRAYREFPLQPPQPYEIRVVDSVSGRDRLVLRRRGDVLDLAVSPDGRRAAVLDDGVNALLLDLASGRQTVLVNRPPLLDAAWSPDGRLLALNGPAIIDPRTKRFRRDDSPHDCFDPDWSPDGRWLVCNVGYGEEDEQRRGGSDLVLVNPTTGARVVLTDSAKARNARWRPLVP